MIGFRTDMGSVSILGLVRIQYQFQDLYGFVISSWTGIGFNISFKTGIDS